MRRPLHREERFCLLRTPTAATESGIVSTRSLSFDGVDDHVSIADADYFNPANNSLTVACWFKATEFQSRSWIVTKADAGPFEWCLFGVDSAGDTGHVAAEIWTEGGGEHLRIPASAITINYGEWAHAAFVYDRDAVTLKLYVNGVLSDTDSTPISTPTAGVSLVRIGARGDSIGSSGSDRCFHGLIDEVAIFNVALSAAEVLAIYQNTSSTYPSGLVGNWIHADEGSGTTTADSSGNGNTGTLTNGVAWDTDVPGPLM